MPSIVPSRTQTLSTVLDSLTTNLDTKRITPTPPVNENATKQAIETCLSFNPNATANDYARMIFLIIKRIKSETNDTPEAKIMELLSPHEFRGSITNHFVDLKVQEIDFENDTKLSKRHEKLVSLGEFITRLIQNKSKLSPELEKISDEIIEGCLNKLHEYTENLNIHDKSFIEPEDSVFKLIDTNICNSELQRYGRERLELLRYLKSSLTESKKQPSTSNSDFTNNLLEKISNSVHEKDFSKNED